MPKGILTPAQIKKCIKICLRFLTHPYLVEEGTVKTACKLLHVDMATKQTVNKEEELRLRTQRYARHH